MYEQITLPNGVRIVTEQIDGLRSAALGIWVGAGSRQEKPRENGAAHFIEHMLFKGTETRTAAEIAGETDAIGAQINAFTTKECTCFYARMLDSHVGDALDILWDMVYHSKFDETDVETERGVILEEIGMYEDAPDDLCAERLFAEVYQGTALGRPILGKPATLKKMTGDSLRAYHKAHYRAADTVVALAGSFPVSVVEELKTRFSALENPPQADVSPVSYQPALTLKKKTIEQNHLILGFPGLSYNSPRRFALQLLSFILGGGMSSRLFQEVREKRGLCYSVYSYGAGHGDTGIFAVYTALNREMEQAALDTIVQVIRDFVAEGPTKEELLRAREQSKASVLMGMESTQARMSHLGRSCLFSDEILSPEGIIAAYDAVTAEDMQALAREIFDFTRVSLSAVGRIAPKEQYEQFLAQLRTDA